MELGDMVIGGGQVLRAWDEKARADEDREFLKQDRESLKRAREQQMGLADMQMADMRDQAADRGAKRALEMRVQELFKKWNGEQLQAESNDRAAANAYGDAMGKRDVMYADQSRDGLPDTPSMAGLDALSPPKPRAPRYANMFDFMADNVGDLPGGLALAQEFRDISKRAKADGLREATQAALMGAPAKDVMDAYNASGTDKLANLKLDADGIYRGMNVQGEPREIEPKKWGTIFGLIKPDEFDMNARGDVLNKRSGNVNRAPEAPLKPNDFLFKYSAGDGQGDIVIDTRNGKIVSGASSEGLSRKDLNDFQEQLNAYFKPGELERLDPENRTKWAQAAGIGHQLLYSGAVDPQTGRKLSPKEIAGRVTEAYAGEPTAEAVAQRLESYMPRQGSRETIKSIADVQQRYGQKVVDTLMANRNNPQALREFNQRVDGDPNSGTAERLVAQSAQAETSKPFAQTRPPEGMAPLPAGQPSPGMRPVSPPSPDAMQPPNTGVPVIRMFRDQPAVPAQGQTIPTQPLPQRQPPNQPTATQPQKTPQLKWLPAEPKRGNFTTAIPPGGTKEDTVYRFPDGVMGRFIGDKKFVVMAPDGTVKRTIDIVNRDTFIRIHRK